jgi:hypothetical protein
MSQTSKHQADHRDIHQRFAGFRQAFVVFAQTALAIQLGEGVFQLPAQDEPPDELHWCDLEISPQQRLRMDKVYLSRLKPVSQRCWYSVLRH